MNGPPINTPAFIETNRNCPPSKEINILLLGQTGVGKSTFINGLINYLCNDTFQEALNDEIQFVIPSSFSLIDNASFEDKTITIGKNDEYETFAQTGHSCTQQCRSFVFPIGQRNLRIIDTPGIGDTRGLDQDTKNFHDILTYISQYEHLNAICILSKPNEERLSILFRFCINELLRHIQLSASENIIFVFTNARSTFYSPGGTAQILRNLLQQHANDDQVLVPFSRENTFLLDNEAFRCLAVRKNGFQLSHEEILSYQKSWDHTVKEYARMVAYIVTRPLHCVRDTLSLNEAEQIIRKLTRPIAETTRLIEQNLQLAKQHKENAVNQPETPSQGIPQNDVKIVKLKHPKTVCNSETCKRVITVNNEQKIDYTSKCHDECYLIGVVQEAIGDERIRECEKMDSKTGNMASFYQEILLLIYRSMFNMWLFMGNTFTYNV